LNEAVAPALGHVRRSRSGVGCYVATSTWYSRTRHGRGRADRLGCGDVVVAHDGSIDAGMLICVPRGSVVQSMDRRRLGRRGSCSALRDQCVI